MKLSYMIDMDESSAWMMVTAGEPAKANIPYVQELGDFMAQGKYYTTREGFPSYLLKYTLSGEGVLEYEGSTWRVPKGHFFWIDCEKPQHYRTSERTGEWRVLWVHFFGPTCKYYYEQFLSANNGCNVGALPDDSPVPTSIYDLMDLYREKVGHASDLRASAILSSIMVDCVAAATQREGEAASRYVREVRDYILSHYTGKITLDELARHLSLNKYYLQKFYRLHTGQTPNEYLFSLRLNHAKEMLRATDKPVGIVAEEVGIENISHFIKQFKRSEGVTPSAYRKRWQAQ